MSNPSAVLPFSVKSACADSSHRDAEAWLTGAAIIIADQIHRLVADAPACVVCEFDRPSLVDAEIARRVAELHTVIGH